MTGILDKEKIAILKEVALSVLPSDAHVWLYGSRARGDAHEGSDWDLLILLPKDVVTIEDEDRIAFPFVLAGWQHNMDVNPQTYTFDEWSSKGFTPYYKNVERDKLLIA